MFEVDNVCLSHESLDSKEPSRPGRELLALELDMVTELDSGLPSSGKIMNVSHVDMDILKILCVGRRRYET